MVSPEEQVLQEADFFLAQIGRLGVNLRAVIVNRMHREVLLHGRAPRRRTVASILRKLGASPELVEALVNNFEAYQALGRGDLLRVEAFQRLVPSGTALITVPNLASDVHSLVGLETLHGYLFAEAAT
ncbi:hypothetical protein HRbin30_02678 [bacterium HR30]|nr:hypothetical protein HRbin30_02678 [bacterium HR30]